MTDPYGKVCTECGAVISGRAKTCSNRCRAARSRRLKRARQEKADEQRLPDHQREVARAARTEATDLARTVIREEMRPVVREAMTEEVLQAINRMVGLAPVAIEMLAMDLMSEDSKVRQKAYDLWLRYTVGHQAIVRPEEAEDSKQLVVNFQLPRPDPNVTVSPGTEALEDDAVVELRTCNLCQEEKPSEIFVAASDRCTECHDKMAAKAQELLHE